MKLHPSMMRQRSGQKCVYVQRGNDLRRHLMSRHSCIIKETEDPVPTCRGHRVTLKSSDLLKLSGAAREAAYRKICLRNEDGDEPEQGGPGKKKKAAKGASAARVTHIQGQAPETAAREAIPMDELPAAVRAGLELTVRAANRQPKTWSWAHLHKTARPHVRLHESNRAWALSGFLGGCDFVAQLHRVGHRNYHVAEQRNDNRRILDLLNGEPALHSADRVVHQVPGLRGTDKSSCGEKSGSQDEVMVVDDASPAEDTASGSGPPDGTMVRGESDGHRSLSAVASSSGK